jgi:hypothetical protein
MFTQTSSEGRLDASAVKIMERELIDQASALRERLLQLRDSL